MKNLTKVSLLNIFYHQIVFSVIQIGHNIFMIFRDFLHKKTVNEKLP